MAQRELTVSFTTTIVPKKEFDQKTGAAAAELKSGLFGTQELDVGGEEFVVVFARTKVSAA